MIPIGSDLERRYSNLLQLGWGDAEIFSRLLSKTTLGTRRCGFTDFLMFCEDDEPYFQALLDPDSVLNTSFP